MARRNIVVESKVPREAEKHGLHLKVEMDTYRMLSVHAMEYGTTISALIDGLVKDHLREFSVVKRKGKP